jgi:hypothetical protein
LAAHGPVPSRGNRPARCGGWLTAGRYSGKLGLANLGNGDHTLQLFQLRGTTGALVGSTKVTITP